MLGVGSGMRKRSWAGWQEGVAVFVTALPPGKIQDTEGECLLGLGSFRLFSGQETKSPGGLVVHSATLYRDIIMNQNVKPVSPSIDEGLSLHDKLLREGINTLSFYLHCPHILSLESLLLAGEAITGVKNEFVFLSSFCHTA